MDLNDLSVREQQVVDHVVAGLSNKQTAHQFGLSFKTVEHYRHTAMHKLGARNAADLVRIVMITRGWQPREP